MNYQEMSGPPKRIGIVGAGQVVEDSHLPVLANMGNIAVSWVADLRLDRLRLLSTMYRIPFIPVEEVAGRIHDVDICLLAIPVGARKEYIDMCAEAGVAVYAEKPFARSLAEHVAYTSLFPAHRLAAGFQRRFYKNLGTLKQAYEDKIFGDLRSIEYRSGQYSLKSGGPSRFLADKALAGGGVLIEVGIHGLDQILFATQADAVMVECVEAVVFDHLDYDVVADSVIVCGQRKVPVGCELTRLRNIQQGTVYRFEAADVTVGADPQDPLKVRRHGHGYAAEYELRSTGEIEHLATTVTQAFFCSWSEFIRGIDTGQAGAASACSSYLTTAWVEAISQRMEP